VARTARRAAPVTPPPPTAAPTARVPVEAQRPAPQVSAARGGSVCAMARRVPPAVARAPRAPARPRRPVVPRA
jgi:hypothetical protein